MTDPGAPPPPWQQPAYPTYVVPDLPKATAALVLGIVAVAGTFMCVLPVLASPVAWVLGAQARKQIRSAPQHWSGEGKATGGMVLGIIGTAMLALLIVVIVVVVAVAIGQSTAPPGTTV